MAEMRRWNREAYRWAAPLAEPLTDVESRTLNALYDAEVTYQDGYLAQLFAQLGRRANADNTLTIIVGDHGDGLGEHDMVGHAFNAYQELVHVPLMVNDEGKRLAKRDGAVTLSDLRELGHDAAAVRAALAASIGLPADAAQAGLAALLPHFDPNALAIGPTVWSGC